MVHAGGAQKTAPATLYACEWWTADIAVAIVLNHHNKEHTVNDSTLSIIRRPVMTKLRWVDALVDVLPLGFRRTVLWPLRPHLVDRTCRPDSAHFNRSRTRLASAKRHFGINSNSTQSWLTFQPPLVFLKPCWSSAELCQPATGPRFRLPVLADVKRRAHNKLNRRKSTPNSSFDSCCM